jgi:hypothetical protein
MNGTGLKDEEIIQRLDEMYERLGPLPNPIHEPKRFAWFVKLYNYYKQRQEEETQ